MDQKFKIVMKIKMKIIYWIYKCNSSNSNHKNKIMKPMEVRLKILAKIFKVIKKVMKNLLEINHHVKNK